MFFPRNPESKKSIHMPADFDKEISSLFISEFKENLAENQSLSLKNLLYETEIICSLNLKTTKQLKQQVFEVSIDYTPLEEVNQASTEQEDISEQSNKIQHLLSFAVDYLSLCLDTFLKENKTPSSQWTKVDFQKQVLFIRHHTSNLDLEEQANKLLGDNFLESLIKETK